MKKPTINRDEIARRFISFGGDPARAEPFARMIEGLAREVPAPRYVVKERRRLTEQAATALRNAADALARLDGICCDEITARAAAYRSDFGPRNNPHPFGSEAYAGHIYSESQRTLSESALRNHPPIGEQHFAFGRHGMPMHPDKTRSSKNRARDSLRGMVADLELLAIAATRAAGGNLQNPVNSLEVLARRLIDTLDVFGMRATGTPNGLADQCMRAILEARGDGGSGLDTLRREISNRLSENGAEITPDS